MEVSSSSNIITIKGNIKAISHFSVIKQEIDTILKSFSDIKHVKINILESISITSTVIEHLCKLVHDDIHIELFVKNKGLRMLLDDLNLTNLLNVQKIYN